MSSARLASSIVSHLTVSRGSRDTNPWEANMTEKFFAIALVGHEITLWVLIGLSVLSLAFILERFFSLSRIRKESQKVSDRLKDLLQTNTLRDLEDLSKD